jgi:peptide deformylase
VTAPYEIRVIGDPVLRARASEVSDIDGKLARLADDMLATMYDAPGVGLAAPQVGVQKRLFVYDIGEGPNTIVNPEIVEVRGEWAYDEGCLSIPGLAFELVRPKEVHLKGYDLEGNEVSIEADELLARAFQHEMDHLDGVLFIERLDDDSRKAAMRIIREQKLSAADLAEAEVAGPARGGFSLR